MSTGNLEKEIRDAVMAAILADREARRMIRVSSLNGRGESDISFASKEGRKFRIKVEEVGDVAKGTHRTNALLIIDPDWMDRPEILSDSPISLTSFNWDEVTQGPSDSVRRLIEVVGNLPDGLINRSGGEGIFRDREAILLEMREHLGIAIGRERSPRDLRDYEIQEMACGGGSEPYRLASDDAGNSWEIRFLSDKDYRGQFGSGVYAYFHRAELSYEEDPPIPIPSFQFVDFVDVLDRTKVERLDREHPAAVIREIRDDARRQRKQFRKGSMKFGRLSHDLTFYVETLAEVRGLSPSEYFEDLLTKRLKEEFENYRNEVSERRRRDEEPSA